MHRYLNSDVYEDGKGADHISKKNFCLQLNVNLVGSYLIVISILSGYLIEKLFKQVLVFVKNWYSLIKLLFILYLAAGIVLMLLHRDALELVEVNLNYKMTITCGLG
jgi:hypothetical protein